MTGFVIWNPRTKKFLARTGESPELSEAHIWETLVQAAVFRADNGDESLVIQHLRCIHHGLSVAEQGFVSLKWWQRRGALPNP